MEEQHTAAFSVYLGDCCELLTPFPDESIDLSVYSPPFCGLYHYSSSERDLSNSRSTEEFLEHYRFVVAQVSRLTKPGRITAVHVADVPQGDGVLYDFPGDVIRLHERCGFQYITRHAIWKPPLAVRLRTMAKGLAHRTICEDGAYADVAGADYLLLFRKRGANRVPITHPTGFLDYAGSRKPPADVLPYRGWTGPQTENRYSHWIWRQYASSMWDDVRMDRVLPFQESRDPDDEKHVHPLQLDVIDRVIDMRSNVGETVLTPFMGVGSEVYAAVRMGRKAIGIELKPSYYRQALRNLTAATADWDRQQVPLFADTESTDPREAVTRHPHTWKPKRKRREEMERAEVTTEGD